MHNVFNMGIGFIIAIAKEDAQKAVDLLKEINEDAYIIGEVTDSGSVDLKW